MAATVLRLLVNIAWTWFFGRHGNDGTTGLEKVKLAFGWVNSTAGERIRRLRGRHIVASAAAPPPFPPNDPDDNEEA